jgi:DNA polymerase-1
MHRNGIYVNLQKRAFILWCIERELHEKKRHFCRLARVKKATADTMRALMFKRHRKAGIPCFNLPDPFDIKMYTNESRRVISVKEECLLNLLANGDVPPEGVPVVDAFWEVQSLVKQRGTVRSKLIDRGMTPDQRLHPGWNSCGTETMRWACSEPNVMNIEQVLRAMFGAPEGRVLVHMDKSRLEVRVMEIVTGDPVLTEGFKPGRDIYVEDAKAYFSLPDHYTKKDLKPEAYKSAKIIRLAKQYMAGLGAVYTQALAQDRNIKFALVKTLSTLFDQRHKSGLIAWAEEEMARVRSCGYSSGRLLDGRRVYPAPPPITEVANYPIQRTAGEMMNLEIIQLDRLLKERVPSAKLIVQLHDAFDVECDEDDADKVVAIYNEVCDREYTIEGRTRRFPVEIKIGKDWSEL